MVGQDTKEDRSPVGTIDPNIYHSWNITNTATTIRPNPTT